MNTQLSPEAEGTGETTEGLLRPDYCLYLMDETQHWQLQPELMAKIERIVTIYLFDRKRHVHCCELTPSYELWPVETRAELKPEFADGGRAADNLRDAIDSEIQRWADHSVRYAHVADMEPQLTPEQEHKKWYHYGDPGKRCDEVAYEKQVEALLEYFNGNQCL